MGPQEQNGTSYPGAGSPYETPDASGAPGTLSGAAAGAAGGIVDDPSPYSRQPKHRQPKAWQPRASRKKKAQAPAESRPSAQSRSARLRIAEQDEDDAGVPGVIDLSYRFGALGGRPSPRTQSAGAYRTPRSSAHVEERRDKLHIVPDLDEGPTPMWAGTGGDLPVVPESVLRDYEEIRRKTGRPVVSGPQPVPASQPVPSVVSASAPAARPTAAAQSHAQARPQPQPHAMHDATQQPFAQQAPAPTQQGPDTSPYAVASQERKSARASGIRRVLRGWGMRGDTSERAQLGDEGQPPSPGEQDASAEPQVTFADQVAEQDDARLDSSKWKAPRVHRRENPQAQAKRSERKEEKARKSEESRERRQARRGQLIVSAVASGLMVVISIVGLYGPSQRLYVAWREQERISEELNANLSRNEQMQTRIDRLQSQEGIEDEARARFGLVMPGEVLGSVTGVDDSSQSDFATPAEIPRGSGENTHTWLTDLGDRVFGVDIASSTATEQQVAQVTEQSADTQGATEEPVNADADIVVQDGASAEAPAETAAEGGDAL